MPIAGQSPMTLMGVLVLVLFNAPILFILVRLPFVADLKQALREKNPVAGAPDSTSYSRVSGLIGAVILTSLFWAIGNAVVCKAFSNQIGDIRTISEGVSKFFMIGSALFLPYAFNQIRSTVAGVTAGLGGSASNVVANPVVTPPNPTQTTLSVVVANLSSIDDATFAAAVAAISTQVNRDFQPLWGSGATLSAQRLTLSNGQANINGAADAIIYFGDESADPTTGIEGVYGYHSVNYGGTPYAFVYLDVCKAYGETWSCTLSHETLELVADPTAVVTISGPAPASANAPGQTVTYDLEVCDPTQGDTYLINNVTVSNFVTKPWFGMASGSASTNFLNLPLAPFGVRPNGYFQYEDSSGTQQVNGQKVDAARVNARKMLRDYRRNARRTVAASKRV